jgi:hypothetical protein
LCQSSVYTSNINSRGWFRAVGEWGTVPGKCRDFCLCHYGQVFQYNGDWGLRGRSVKLTIHFHRVPRSRMRRALPSHTHRPVCIFDSDFLKVYDNGWFILRILCWTPTIIWGMFDLHNVSETVSVSIISCNEGKWAPIDFHYDTLLSFFAEESQMIQLLLQTDQRLLICSESAFCSGSISGI